MTHEDADAIAIKALQYITGDSALLTRFMDVSGLAPSDLRDAAARSEFWAAILDFLRQDEAECLAFAGNMGLTPSDIEKAALLLGGGEPQALDI